MPHLNDLNEKYSARGLSILALTIETKELTEPWIAEKGVKYAYGYDKGGKLKNQLGIGGIPDAVLVDPSGRVVWQGHPAGLKDEQIEPLLAGALEVPLFEWPASAAAVRKLVANGQLGKALPEAEKLGEQPFDAAKAIRKVVDGRLATLKAAHESGDYFTADEVAKDLKKRCAGLPAADEAARVAAAIAADAKAGVVLKAQARVRKLAATEVRSKKDAAELLEQLRKLAGKQAGTAAARDAEAAIADLEAKLADLR